MIYKKRPGYGRSACKNHRMKRTDLSLMRTATDIQQAFTCRIRNLAGHVCVPPSIYFLYNMVTYCTGEVNKGPCITLGLGGFATFFRPGCRREGRRPTTISMSGDGARLLRHIYFAYIGAKKHSVPQTVSCRETECLIDSSWSKMGPGTARWLRYVLSTGLLRRKAPANRTWRSHPMRRGAGD